MSKKKKIIILSCMVLLLAVTAVFNFVLSGSAKSADDDPIATAAYFSQYKTERSQSRAEQLVQLNEIIAADNENTDAKDEALNLKLKLTEIIESELLVETLIEARGYEDALVSIGLTSDNVNVMVKDADFTQDDAVVIYTILSEELKVDPSKVTIVPIS